MYVSRIFIPCYMRYSPVGTNTGKTGLFGPSSKMPDVVNIVVIFHAFTGLQCRLQDYLYLVACIVLPSTRHPFPKEGFRRFVIRFCGLTYNTVNHLNVFHDPNPVSPPYSITRKLFFRAIKTKLLWNLISAMYSGFSYQFFCTA